MPSSIKRNPYQLARVVAAALPWAIGASIVAIPSVANAQAAAQPERRYQLDIPAQPLEAALVKFADATGIQLIYSAEVARGLTSASVIGELTAAEGIARLLAGTGLSYRITGSGAITIERTAGANGERVLGAVRVEGAQGSPYFGGAGQAAGVNGVNGSRDITATEGTGSYTSGALTIGSKSPQAMKDVPQSVSVITAQRLEEQNITDFTSAMNQAPGITLVQGETSLQTAFYSRGFPISTIQIDGGAPLTTKFANNNDGTAYYPQIDLSQYDHVEVLRGAAGLFNGYGDPSGTVNLVRKKPLNQRQVILEAQAGSWNNYRLVMDASAPLGLDGKLRGRLVTTYQANDYFYEVAKDNKAIIYGIAEYDLTPSTLVTVGASFTHQESSPWSGGLPRYQNGDDLKLSRDTCFCFPWNSWNFETLELFTAFDKDFGSGWNAKINLTYNDQKSDSKLGYSSGTVNPIDQSGLRFAGSMTEYASKQLVADFTLSGTFEMFGQRQEIVLGANRRNTDNGGLRFFQELVSGSATSSSPYLPYPGGPAGVPAIAPFAFNPLDPLYTEPRDTLPYYRYDDYSETQSGLYANLRLALFDRMHLITGIRYSRYHYSREYGPLCVDISALGCEGKMIGDPEGSMRSGARYTDVEVTWPPPVSIVYDINDRLSAYAGYTDIYVSQANLVDRDLKSLAPITGSNIETGLKWESFDGKLNASIAAYVVKKENFAASDMSAYVEEDFLYYFVDNKGNRYPFGVVSGDGLNACCYVNDARYYQHSRGVDVEISGELSPGWQIAANYTWNKNEYRGDNLDSIGVSAGRPLETRQPRHLLKLWTSYSFRSEGWIGRLQVSGGVNAQSKAYRAGSACTKFSDPDPTTNVIRCLENAEFDYVQDPYAVWSARIDYRLTDRWLVALNVQNLTDTRYYQTMGSSTSGNWYGAPRSFTLSLRGKW